MRSFYGWGWGLYGKDVMMFIATIVVFALVSICASLYVGAEVLPNLLVTLFIALMFTPIRSLIGGDLHKSSGLSCFLFSILLLTIPVSILPLFMHTVTVIVLNIVIIVYTSAIANYNRAE